jgi:hypothetical protein
MPEVDRTSALIDALTADARPVRRVWSLPVRLGLFGLVVCGTLAGLAVAGFRPDVGARLATLGFAGELATLAVAASLLARAALATAVPAVEAGWAFAVLLLVAALGLDLAGGAPLGDLHTTLAAFVDSGIGCALQTATLALAPWVALLLAVRRGAPFARVAAGALAGAAGWLVAYALMRLRCPNEAVLHVAVWHGLPVLGGVLVSAGLGVLVFRRPFPRPSAV